MLWAHSMVELRMPSLCIAQSVLHDRAIGGFKETLLMEDVDLVLRLGRRYGPPCIVPGPVRVSARRWLKLGYVKTTLLNWLLVIRWCLGADPDHLAAVYYGDKYDRPCKPPRISWSREAWMSQLVQCGVHLLKENYFAPAAASFSQTSSPLQVHYQIKSWWAWPWSTH